MTNDILYALRCAIITALIAVVTLLLFIGLLAYLTRRTVKQSVFRSDGRAKQIPALEPRR